MSAARARKILLAAFAVSVLLHLLLAGYIRWPALLRPQAETRIAKVRVITVARVTPAPPPPTPVPTPASTPSARASVVPPPVKSRVSKALPAAPKAVASAPTRTAPPRASPAPTPLATPGTTACVRSSSDPAVAATPDAAQIPPEVRAAKVSGTAAIEVSLDPKGRVLDARVAQSTGNAGLDTVAAQMARGATYTPKYVNCKAVAGTYTFTVKFVAW